MARVIDLDLTNLPYPQSIEELDYEGILAERLLDLKQRWAGSNIGGEYDVSDLETDPLKIDQEVSSYRETLVRQRINDAIKATHIAYAIGDDLDNVCARLGVTRLLLQEADEEAGTPAIYESDDRLRTRFVLALEAFSTAGPELAYVYWAMTANAGIKHVRVYGPESTIVDPGEVGIYVLSGTGDGTADQAMLDEVEAICSADDIRPLTDSVLVSSATPTNYTIEVTLDIYRPLDPAIVTAAAEEALNALVASRHRIGSQVPLSAIYAAAHVEGVEEVTIVSPVADVDATAVQAPYCTGITVNYNMVDP